MSPRRRWVGSPHADPEIERSTAELYGRLEEMTDRLRTTVEALEAEEDAAALRQEETTPPETDPEDLHP